MLQISVFDCRIVTNKRSLHHAMFHLLHLKIEHSCLIRCIEQVFSNCFVVNKANQATMIATAAIECS